MSADSSTDSLMEEREELMVPPIGGNPTLRSAHFLKPTLNCLSSKPYPCPASFFKPAIFYPKKNQLKSLFKCQKNLPNKWKAWVYRLQSTYQHIWSQAGIHEAILASTCEIPKDNSLIMGLAERWCVETNTFIFPFGEATLTLEDTVVLGGYSLLGDSVLSPVITVQSVEIISSLKKALKEIRSSRSRNASQLTWMDYFMATGNNLEHEAFLIFWLSRFVFSSKYDYVASCLFPVAIHLSKGTPIALAPAVLASIYRDLSLLKRLIADLSKFEGNDGDDHVLATSLSSPIQLVLLWARKRFCGEPRLGRWYGSKKWDVKNVREALDSAGELFLWRPYGIASNSSMFRKLYKKHEEWVLVESDMDKELECYARCLRVSQLVGLDCIEQYLPNRVAMQFGFDQDIPAGYVTGHLEAWSNYIRPIRDIKLYVPPRQFESDVTPRYLEWYKGSPTTEDLLKSLVIVRKKRSTSRNRVPRDTWGGEKDSGFVILPVSLATCDREEAGDYNIDEDKIAIAKLVGCKSKSSTSGDVLCAGDEPVQKPAYTPSASYLVENDGDFPEMEAVNMTASSVGRPKRGREEADLCEPNNTFLSIGNDEDKSSWDGTIEEVEVRISRLERVVAALKAAKLKGRLKKRS